MRLQSKYNRETRRNIRTTFKHTVTTLLSVVNRSVRFVPALLLGKSAEKGLLIWVTEK